MRRSLGNNGAELLVFDTYLKLGFDLPALIPLAYGASIWFTVVCDDIKV